MSNSVSNDIVQSAGNSWIIRRSKSYTDRIYYFNTLTGEAVWNLSEVEMEKARQATKKFGKAIDNCPEPEGSPEDYVSKNNDNRTQKKFRSNEAPKVYNKQIINNQFTRSPSFSTINPMQLGIAVPSMYNPLIWNVPSQPVIITDYSVPPNINTYIPVSGTSIPLSSRFKSFSEANNAKFIPLNKQNSREIIDNSLNAVNSEENNGYKKRFKTKLDLREILSAKRKNFRRKSESSQSVFEGETPSGSPNALNENALLDMRDEEWLVENLRSNVYSNLDTSALRKLVKYENNTVYWYIVTDTNVLLNNTNFLKVLLHTDKQCNLIVPRVVVEEIAAMSHLNPQAQRATYFISQQVDLNQLVIDEERLGDKSFYIQDEILGCCSRLSEQGCPVVLISNNIEILHLKEIVMYQIITMREVKMLLCRKLHSGTHPVNYLPYNDAEANIKITIPNEPNGISPKNEVTNYIVTDIGSVEVTPGPSHFGEEITNIQHVSYEPKNITENEVTPGPSCFEEITNIQHVSYEPNNITENEQFVDNDRVLRSSSKPAHMNKIKLNRNTSYDSSKSGSNEVKNFKWRRKKMKMDNLNVSDNTCSTKTVDEDSCNSHNSDFIEPEGACNVNDIDTNNVNSETIVPLKDFNTNDDTPINNSNKVEQVSSVNLKPSSKEDKNVMFEIISQTMEENLKMKCDEWVSRFTQVMEEVLTQVLYKEPKFVCEAMPPPWSLYEATECTRKKFQTDCDIVDAANKLRNILFDIGGSRGKVKKNISPQQYMEMYSYGVYLTDSLQAALNDCEDLQIAAESLSKLLSDIQDPNLDINDQNSFHNVSNEDKEKTTNTGNISDKSEKQLSSEKNVKVYQLKDAPQIMASVSDDSQRNIANKINEMITSPVKCNTNTSNETLTSPLKYNLRSSRRSTPQKKQYSNDPESCFFKSLHLIKRTINGIEVKDNQESRAEENSNTLNVCDKIENEHSADNNEKTDSIVNKDTRIGGDKNIEPKIIRNFVRCLDFEEKIQRNIDFSQNVDFLVDQGDEEGYNFEDDFFPNYVYDESEMNEEYIENYDLYEEYDEEEFEEKANMNCFIGNIIKESKDALSLVQFFCEKSYDILKSSSNEIDKSEILREAIEANTNIINICDTLDSILKRETSGSEDSIRAVSKNPFFNCVEMSDEEVKNYRNVVEKCLEQGNVLKESVAIIINAIELKT